MKQAAKFKIGDRVRHSTLYLKKVAGIRELAAIQQEIADRQGVVCEVSFHPSGPEQTGVLWNNETEIRPVFADYICHLTKED